MSTTENTEWNKITPNIHKINLFCVNIFANAGETLPYAEI